MIDDESQLPTPETHHREAMFYDYMKHLASLSLITLGGILTISQMDATDDIKPFNLIVAIVLVGVGGALAFACATEMAQARFHERELSRTFRFASRIAPVCFVIGIGYALAMFVDVMV